MARSGNGTARRSASASLLAMSAVIALVGCSGGPETPVTNTVETREDGSDPTVLTSEVSSSSEAAESAQDESQSRDAEPEEADDVDPGIVLGSLSSEEPGSTSDSKVSRQFAKNRFRGVEEAGLSKLVVGIGSQDWARHLELPRGRDALISWGAWTSGSTTANLCRAHLVVEDDDGEELSPPESAVTSMETCRTTGYGDDGIAISFKSEGDYKVRLTMEFPGDAPNLSVEQVIRVVDL